MTSPMAAERLSTELIRRIFDVTKNKKKPIYYRYKTINEIVQRDEELLHFV